MFDVEESIQYYEDVLGFPGHWSEGDPPDWGGVSGVVMNLNSELVKKARGSQFLVPVDDIEESFNQHKSKGAKIKKEIAETHWNSREYHLEDINGYIWRFLPRLSRIAKRQACIIISPLYSPPSRKT